MSMRIESGGTFDGLKMVVRSDEDISAYSTVTWDLLGVSEPSVEDSSTAENKNPCVGITGPGGIASGRQGEILLYGVIENRAWSWSAPQIPLYLSAVDGQMGEAPAGPWHQQVATTITTTKILFDPMSVWEI